jgi:hypothetical protein
MIPENFQRLWPGLTGFEPVRGAAATGGSGSGLFDKLGGLGWINSGFD